MKKIGFGFSKMNQDTSAGARKPEDYYDALNMINTPTEDNVLGGIMSDKGNALQVRIPNIVNDQLKPGTFYTTYDTTVSQLPPSTFIQSYPYTNLQFSALPILVVPQIIGQVEYKEFIYFVTTGSTGTPTGTNDGQVWRYNTTTQVLDLVYYGFLNLSIDFPITGIHFIEETESNQRLYFIDHHNQLQVMNVANPDVFNLPSTAFKIIGDVTLESPTFVNSLRGGYFQAGLVGYAYQLYNSNGTMTKLSPISEYININEQFVGNEETEFIGISTNIEVTNLDGNYSGVRLYRIHYINPNQEPIVHLIEEFEYNSSIITANFVDDGAKNIEPYSLQELLYLFNRTLFTGRAITTKDNHMFIGNLKEYPYLPDYDARAYRFSSAGTARIDDTQGHITTITPGSIATVPEKHDAINPSNYADERSNNTQPGGYYFNNPDPLYKQYIYQANGSTIGGTGPNVSYTFSTQRYRPADMGALNSGFILNNRSFAQAGNYSFRMYKRDEIYRFGIVLYNEYMQPSPVKWIGDIRFPTTDSSDGNFELTTQAYDVDPANYGFLQALYVDFRVTNLPSDCIGYQIVRVPRTERDKTISFQALVQPMVYGNTNNVTTNILEYADKYQPSLYPRAIAGGLLGAPFVAPLPNYQNNPNLSNQLLSPQSWWQNFPVFGANVSSGLQSGFYYNVPVLPIPDALGDGTSADITTVQSDNILQLFSPEIEVNQKNTTLLDPSYLKTVGGAETSRRAYAKYETSLSNALVPYGAGYNNQPGNVHDQDNYGMIYYFWSARVQTNKDRAKVALISEAPIYTPESQNGDANNITNITYRFPNSGVEFVNKTAHVLLAASNAPSGVTDGAWFADNNHCATVLLGGNNFTSSFSNMITDIYNPGTGTNAFTPPRVSVYGVSDREKEKFPIVDYKVFNRFGIYNGNSYEARTNNEYIAVTDFIPKTVSTTTVRNGDTFLSYWGLERSMAISPGGFRSRGTFRTVIMVPIETTINIDARTDGWRSYLRQINTLFSNGPTYNNIYHFEPYNFTFKPLPLNYKPNTKFDYRLVASNSKVYGEYLDNWSLYEFNQVMDLDPERGHISNLHRLQEEVIAIQSQGINLIKINPDITVTSTEGSQIELAEGSLLYSNSYIDRTAGASTTFGSIELPGSIMLVDDLNKKVKLLSTQGNTVLSDIQGISSYLRKNVDFDIIRLDNPYKNTGLAMGYYPDKQMVYITFNLLDINSDLRPQPDNSFTLGYSLFMQGFTSRYSFTPSAYVSSLGRLYSIPDDNKSLWKHEVGLYANYYGTQYESSISLFGAAEGLVNSTWDNLSYTGRLLDLNNNDIYDESFTSIRVYNEHQDSGTVSLVPFQNQRHRDRKWNIGLPRVQGSRARISNPWAIMELSYLGDGTKRIIVDSANATYRLYPSSYI